MDDDLAPTPRVWGRSFWPQAGCGVCYAPSVAVVRGCPMFWSLFDITDTAVVLRVALIALFVFVISLNMRDAA